MARRKTSKKTLTKKQIKFWASVIVAVVLAVMQQTGKPIDDGAAMPDETLLQDVSIASVYDGDTFKINLNCSLAVYCQKMPVRVLGVDTPEIKGKTEKEKRLAQQAKAFTKEFLSHGPISLSQCGRDKYFRLLCAVQNGTGQDLAQELIKRDLGYAYDGGKKSTRYQ